MRIDNNYTQYRQPNFGRLKSIKYGDSGYLNLWPKETSKLLRTIKESKAFNEFFEKYDVDMLLNTGISSINKKHYVNLTLKTTVPKTEGNNWYPKIIYKAEEGNKEILYNCELVDRLTRIIKDVEFSDLKRRLECSLEHLTSMEQMRKSDKKARAEIANITNSLLTQDLPVESRKKTFFEKLFGWLK